MGCGVDSSQLSKEFLVMNNNITTYKNLEFIDEDPDYYVIISFALHYEHFVPEKSILFQMEPWVYDTTKNWGRRVWPKEWSDPDPNKFLYIKGSPNSLNVAQWMFSVPETINMDRKDKFIAIISEKIHDEGHINRVNFIKYVEEQGHDIIDVYGTANHHNFRNYKGKLDSKIKQQEYKYVFSVENNREYNYATEKIWESFISCSLCYYDGCPNLSDYVSQEAYVSINTTKKEETLQLMLNAIENNLWSKRLYQIIHAKDITITEYGFLPVIYKIINKIE